ncbi:hypothetical protein FRIGORI9N_360080 [Frigoribacterium sp. 9N]|nr:hypothetical protein FRIGORI9N_360080 [Frigoribacterium sp. 9N]
MRGDNPTGGPGAGTMGWTPRPDQARRHDPGDHHHRRQPLPLAPAPTRWLPTPLARTAP